MSASTKRPWPIANRFFFHFFFIYFLLYFNPFSLFGSIPLVGQVAYALYSPFGQLVYFLNEHLFHVKKELVPMGGSGDTSFGWAQFYTFLLVSLVGAFFWTLLDRKRQSYLKLHYFLCLLVRYSVAATAFSYGILKVLAMQMYFPNISQLATPLGDYLPMRLSWLFIGYSVPYQVFSGIAEVSVALLLLWRRTATLGALVAVGVFANVVMLNLSYDIPVKIYSSHLLLASLFLVWQDRERLLSFFVKNEPAEPSIHFQPAWKEKWFGISRWILKLAFVASAFGFTSYSYFQYFRQYHSTLTRVVEPIDPGMYHVEVFVKNRDTIPESLADTLRWRDVIFDYNGAGSFSANDSSFRMRYGRAYFDYRPDSAGKMLEWRKTSWDSLPLMVFDMGIPEKGRMTLYGIKETDTLSLVLKKLPRHFPLTERQFHWLSESNR